MPPREVYDRYLDGIWKREWLTNNGPLVNELELQLKKYLGVKHMLYLGNGTIALQIAIKALELKGEIITTPFSYVATTSSIVWEGCKPIFVDIDPETLNIDSTKIESVINPDTSAILATHCFGNPCNIEAIQNLADKYKLKVIYDAAHCFGTMYKGRSVFEYGDISTTSFHSTKLFHTIEGGAVFTQDPVLLKKMAHMRNFGHEGPEKFNGIGINGKNSEFHAAMGLTNLKFIESVIEKRKLICERYDLMLANLKVSKSKVADNSTINYAYYPILFRDHKEMMNSLMKLNGNEIFPRRYFFPSLASSLPYLDSIPFSVTDDIASRVLCLPLFYDLSIEEVDFICRLLLRVQNN